MAVLLADRVLGVRAQQAGARDAHGDVFPAGWGPLRGPWPGRAREGPDTPRGQESDRTWRLAVDPAAWPLYQGDLVVQVAGDGTETAAFLVTSADLITHSVDPAVDYIRVEANRHTEAGTSP